MSDILMKFVHEDDGAALTEYVVLLGILVVGVIAAVAAFGGALSTVWAGWAAWIGSGDRYPTT